MQMKKVMVTGGAGFLGSHIVNRLVADKSVEEIVVVDSLLTGTKDNIPLSPKVRFYEQDVIELDSSECFNVEYDEIYHLACPASPIHYEKNPIHTTLSAVIGTLNVLKLATACDAKVLITSTSEVYGDPLVTPQSEVYNGNVPINGPRSCYDEGKRCAESLCFDFWRKHRTKIKVARLFNTYGPNMLEDDGRVVSNFITQALKGLPLTVYGSGSQTRSFCYVSDTIEALFRFMRTDYHVTGPINIGNPKEMNIMELAIVISKEIGSTSDKKVEIIHKDLPVDDPQRRNPDITLAKEQLGWEPVVELVDGLVKTIKFFREKLTEGNGR